MRTLGNRSLALLVATYLLLSGLALTVMAYRTDNWLIFFLGLSSIGYCSMQFRIYKSL